MVRNIHYVYVIQSLNYGNRYVGSTDNLLKRFNEHNVGKCRYTSGRRPWKLIYQEKFNTISEAIRREKFLKSGQGRKYLDEILE